MAGVMQKSCKACGKLHPMNAMRCTCGARLIDAPTVVVDALEESEAPAVDKSAPVGRWTCKYCHFAQNDEKEDTCQLCEGNRDLPADGKEPAAIANQAAYILRFPFGDITFRSSLAIGRDPDFCQFSEKLQLFSKVSRKHAILEVDAECKLTIVDMGSTNGTYVNGVHVDHEKRSAVSIGDEISFSRGLTCRIHKGD